MPPDRQEDLRPRGLVSDTRVLLDGFGMGESPRWHEGRLWFSNWGTNEIVAVDIEGNSEVIGAGGGGSGWAVNWLRDGRMLVTGGELLRVEPDAARVRHADLRDISPYGWSEITVDGRGHAYSSRRRPVGSSAPGCRCLTPAGRKTPTRSR
jgi:sugar lactone lactonase YvrE